MEETLQFTTSTATYSARAGSDFLGGGQTAAVYRVVSSSDNQTYALKLLTDPAYETRFFQEVEWLGHLAKELAEYRLEVNGLTLTPTMHVEQSEGDQRFFVMDLAPGKPLDELWRSAPQGRLDEQDALVIASQLARVFAALHDRLNRSYLDFQPRNVFWDDETRQIMVIDWNLLSPSGQADVVGDVRTIGLVLYRMALGSALIGRDRWQVTSHPYWQDLSLGTRHLLLDLLSPLPGHEIRSATELRRRLEQQLARWDKTGDELVQEAARLIKSIQDQKSASEPASNSLAAATECLDLAQRRLDDVSPTMRPVLTKLQEDVAGRQREASALRQGVEAFVKIGDVGNLFEEAKHEAEHPVDRLQVDRWRAILAIRDANASTLNEKKRSLIEALMSDLRVATMAYLDPEQVANEEALSWEQLAINAKQLLGQGGYALIQPLADEAGAWPMLMALQQFDWEKVPGDTWQEKSAAVTKALVIAKQLPYSDTLRKLLNADDGMVGWGAVETAASKLQRAAETDTQYMELVNDATLGKWDAIDIARIGTILEKSHNAPIPMQRVRTFFGAATAGRRSNPGKADSVQDGVPLVERLFDGLISFPQVTVSDRAWMVEAFRWIREVQRLERYLSLWQEEVDQATSQMALSAGGADTPEKLPVATSESDAPAELELSTVDSSVAGTNGLDDAE